jgi:hypothetical protein
LLGVLAGRPAIVREALTCGNVVLGRQEAELELGAQEAETFLEKHHAGLLGKGCYVFLHDQNFGIGDRPDILWVVPTADKFAVMAFTGGGWHQL